MTSVASIKTLVAQAAQIDECELSSARRSTRFSRPRHIAIYLARHVTPHSLPAIGRLFGNRDHSTVLNALQRIDEYLAEHPQAKDDAAAIVAVLRKSET